MFEYTISADTADNITKDVLKWHFNFLCEDIIRPNIHPQDVKNNIATIKALAEVLQYFGEQVDIPQFNFEINEEQK